MCITAILNFKGCEKSVRQDRQFDQPPSFLQLNCAAQIQIVKQAAVAVTLIAGGLAMSFCITPIAALPLFLGALSFLREAHNTCKAAQSEHMQKAIQDNLQRQIGALALKNADLGKQVEHISGASRLLLNASRLSRPEDPIQTFDLEVYWAHQPLCDSNAPPKSFATTCHDPSLAAHRATASEAIFGLSWDYTRGLF